jgi:hypothetical protein
MRIFLKRPHSHYEHVQRDNCFTMSGLRSKFRVKTILTKQMRGPQSWTAKSLSVPTFQEEDTFLYRPKITIQIYIVGSIQSRRTW